MNHGLLTGPAAGAARVADAPAMRRLGEQLARLLRAGDLVVLSGDLGAGKTTLVQGIGAGLGVPGPITSPTFVIARVHRPADGGLPLVHVDAYRLASAVEVDDLDLDADLADAVTVVEWGAGKVEALAEDRLDVWIEWAAPGADAPAADERQVAWRGVGERWESVRPAARRGTSRPARA